MKKSLSVNNLHNTTNKNFAKVISSCASPYFGRKETWINKEIKSSFINLHYLGKAKSIEITRFKGLGEINPEEFKLFISNSMKLKAVGVNQDSPIDEILSYYMGKNTQDRQKYIINNLIDYEVLG